MSTPRIDHAQVRGARIRGLKPSIIAQRLGCSERTVRRICQDLPANLFISDLVNTPYEPQLWQAMRREGKSYRDIGRVYCLSHEHIRMHLAQSNIQHQHS